MIELTVVRGPGKGSSIALTPDRSVTIGTSADAEIRVGGDVVAGEQVVVKALKGGGFGAKAIAGTFDLNGRAAEAARLRHGDVLSLGDTEIRYAERGNGDEVPEIAGFRLLGVLGRGGWGTVYRAEQKSLGREVALKVLSKERLDDPMFVGRFQAEARAAARLHHPNVVQVFDVDHDGERWFYSMELMHGGSLEQRLKREGKLELDAAVQAIHDAAKGLAFAEQMRIVHCDIKPDNLMVDRHGHVKIADLGLAMADEEGQEGKLVGTPHFMSPEQVRKQPLDHRSDLYSLGCTFYRLATGRTPFQADRVKQILRAQLEEDPTPANEVEPSVPPAVAAVIARLMAKDPDARYQSAAELLEDLERVAAPPARRGLWIGVSAIATVLAVVAVLVLVLNGSSDPQVIKTTEYVENPEAQRAIEENRRIEAENALLRVRMRGLDGLALADALEAMAADHPDTPAAEQALTQATRIRDEERRRAAMEAARRQRVEAAVTAMQDAFEARLGEGDLPAAAAVLAGNPGDPEIADAPALLEARSALEDRLRTAADERLASLQAAVDAAVEARDPDAVRAALAPIEALLGPEGWPASLLGDRERVVTYVEDRRTRAAGIHKELLEEAQAEAWSALRAAVLGPEGAARLATALRFEDAARRLDGVAAGFPDFAAGARARELAPAFRAASRYLQGFTAAATSGSLEITDPRTGERVPVAGFDPAHGLTVKTGPRIRPKEETIALAELLRQPASWFIELPDVSEVDRAVFLGIVTMGLQVSAGRDYLASLDPTEDRSGTGDEGFHAPGIGLQALAETIAAASAEWASPLADELRATNLLARGLSALSARRNLTAAATIDRLLTAHEDTLVVRCLRDR